LVSALALLAAWVVVLLPQTGIAAEPAGTAPPARQALAPADSWTFSASLYAWAAGLDGRVRTLPPLPAVNVNLSIGDVLGHLDGAVMGWFEARHDRLMLMTDLTYSRISPERSFSIAGINGTVALSSSAFIGLGAVGYRIFEGETASFDAFVGVRLWSLKNELTVSGPGPLSLTYGRSQAWADGVVGGRLQVQLTDRLSAMAIGAVGGLSADLEWDVFAGLRYAISGQWSGFAGYRALHVDYKNGNFLYKATQQGPILGISVKF
jgi:hypothetical protein